MIFNPVYDAPLPRVRVSKHRAAKAGMRVKVKARSRAANRRAGQARKRGK